MNKKVEQGRVTRDHLVAIATRLFTERGYDGTSIDAVLGESGVSRGALYHHFGGKDLLFAAVLEAVSERVDEHMTTATRGSTDPMSALRDGCLAWIRLAGDPTVRQVLLIDAPTVLGWQRWRQLDEDRTLGMVKGALGAAAVARLLAPQHVDYFAHALLASMNEIAMMIARSDDHATALKQAEAAVDELLRRLLGQMS